ncbi:MAG: HAMP domain-containing protein [Vicinamibacteria bacterium]|nr:HAMP domain-containing protein [Vicinamibacteria bacterium]
MGRLFWKFFFSYWAALLIAVIGVQTAVYLYRAEKDPEPLLVNGPYAEYAVGSSAVTLRHGGLPALRELIAALPATGGPRLHIVDEAGRDVFGQKVPPGALARARFLAASDETTRIVRQVRLDGGESYLLFMPSVDRLLHGGGPHSPYVPLTVGLVASLCFGALLAWYVSRPVRHLQHACASLAGGRLETRVAPLMGGRRDEIADLGKDFDRMARQLQALITAQHSLLHDVSHELRSPLARLQAAIGLARQNPRKIETMLERIEREAVRVDELVGELLTLSRLGSGVDSGSAERAQRTDLADLVASIAADASFEAQSSGRSVVFTCNSEASADARVELLHRAFENVIRNALKYTNAGSSVEVDAGTTHDRAAFIVTVSDRGPGVPEDDLETIFSPFYRGPCDSSAAGFGLGLAIARRAVEAHGGAIHARNRAGGGLVVEILLPLDRAGTSSPPQEHGAGSRT